ncbi:hypothetical protein QE152_g6480 [Popillia japonica]|uniref:Uncharacterized protein n=1 Tax=Popillia japonica TaxID=7064 RepID=A0AAW1MH23_POPJA
MSEENPSYYGRVREFSAQKEFIKILTAYIITLMSEENPSYYGRVREFSAQIKILTAYIITLMSEENPSYYGRVREFSAQDSDWVIYKRRLDNYFLVNGIADDGKKKAILLNAFDEEAYKLMYNLCLPKLPEDKSYKELADLFNKYFKVAESIFVARSKFFAAFKNSSETANEWAARVRSLASNCSFEEAIIDMMLRDRFIIGFNKGAAQSKLFKEAITRTQSKLFKEAITRTFAEVIEVAVAEMAAEVPSGTASNIKCVKIEPGIHHVTSRNMKGQMTSTSSTKDQSIQRSPGKCFCCGRSNHDTAKCRCQISSLPK